MIKQLSIADKYQDTEQNGQLWPKLLPIALLVATCCAFLGLDAVLPLQNLRFHDALLKHLGSWPLWPAHILFHRFPVAQDAMDNSIPIAILIIRSWKETGALYGALLVIFLLYLLALHYLPRLVTFRYIFISTLILGAICVFIPVVTSGDVFSYIAYARLGVIYHLNPLSTLPAHISTDAVYKDLYWTNQPSIYGPTWLVITFFLQWLTLISGFPGVWPMVLALRLLGLAMHLGSTWLVCLISGSLQSQSGFIAPEKRVRATLAFAWNPLLLFEACVNAHVDVTLLFFTLLALWFLVWGLQTTMRWQSVYLAPLLVAVMFAVATCVKANAMLLVLGLLFFLLTQPDRLRKLTTFTVAYLTTIALLYIPFWQGGVTFTAFRDNPGTFRNINSLPAFLAHLYNSIAADFGQPVVGPKVFNSPADIIAHQLSIAIFALILGIVCWRSLRRPNTINSVRGLVGWWAGVWLLYCFVGSSWFWPWYLVTFFGFYALVEATSKHKVESFAFLRLPLAVRILAFSMLSMYCFYAWAPQRVVVAGLPAFFWTYLGSPYIWLLPLLANQWLFRPHLELSARTHKLRETRWREVRMLFEKGLLSFRSRAEL